LFVDQPVGTGFSYADNPDEYVHDETQVAQDMYEFLQGFFKAFPQYQGLDFYVTGESYAGHYVPAVANRIFNANLKKEGPYAIPLQGFAIGNGLTNPAIQYQDYGQYSLDHKLISQDTYNYIENTLNAECAQAYKSGTDPSVCQQIPSAVQSGELFDFNVYDVRKECGPFPLCYDMSGVTNLMGQSAVRDSLGVFQSDHWSQCDTTVYSYLSSTDWWFNCETYIPPMINAGIRALVYSGKEDWICNWYGGREWVKSMEWDKKADFDEKLSKMQQWLVNGKVAGEFATSGPLTFLAVDEAGHMVPMDQPENALEMLSLFIHNKPFGAAIEIA